MLIVLVAVYSATKRCGFLPRCWVINLGKVENGLVSVDAYGVIDSITFLPMFEVVESL